MDDERDADGESEEHIDDKRDDNGSPKAGVEDAAPKWGFVKSDLRIIKNAKGQCLRCFIVGQGTERTTTRCSFWVTNDGDSNGGVLYLLGVVFVGNDHPC